MLGFCTCTNIIQVPGYNETNSDVQFTDNYSDNRVSIPALVIITVNIHVHVVDFVVQLSNFVCFSYKGVAVIDNLLYAVGGSNRDDGTRSNLNSMERYNPDRDEWEEMPPMHRSRGAASVTALGGCLYAVGGYDSG